MAMRYQWPETVMTKVVKSLTGDVRSAGKWIRDKGSSVFNECLSVDDNINSLPQLTRTEIMSPTDIPMLGDILEDDPDLQNESEDEELIVTVPNLADGSRTLLTAETTRETIVHLQGDTPEDSRLQKESADNVFKDAVVCKEHILSEGILKVSHGETHVSAKDDVAEHVNNGNSTLAKPKDSPSVIVYSHSSANNEKVLAVAVLEAVDSSPIEPTLPEFNYLNVMGCNTISWNTILDPNSIPRIPEEFIDDDPNAVYHKGSKLYETPSGVWVAELIVQKPLSIDKC